MASKYPPGQHTPGPWEYRPEGDSDGEVVGIDHFVIAGDVELACPPREEDARLMAAAPDLLLACKEMLTILKHLERCEASADDGLGEYLRRLRNALSHARAAIAKAEGD